VVEPIVAMPVLPLLHVPPPVPSDNVVIDPIQTDAVPEIEAGTGLTVTVVAMPHPVAVII